MKTEENQRDDVLAVERLAASLSTAFGVLATLLAAIGLYGVMAFLVARRTREIGVRMALGAGVGDVIWIVMREVLLISGDRDCDWVTGCARRFASPAKSAVWNVPVRSCEHQLCHRWYSPNRSVFRLHARSSCHPR